MNAGYSVDQYDMVEPSLDTVITDTTYIDYTNVDYVTGSYTEVIPCTVNTVYSSKMEEGTTTLTEGKNGEQEVHYTSKIVNGVTVETVVNNRITLSAAVNGTKVVGTKKPTVTTSENVKTISTLTPSAPIELDANGNLTTAPLKWTDDWAEEALQTGMRQEYNVSLQGGNSRASHYLSFGYLDDQGIITNSDYSRFSMRANGDYQVNDFISVNGSVSYARGEQNSQAISSLGNYVNTFMFTQSIAPIYPVYGYDADGNLVYDDKGNPKYDFGDGEFGARTYGSNQNVVASDEANMNRVLSDNFSGRFGVDVAFLKHFKFTVNGGYDLTNSAQDRFQTPTFGDAQQSNGRAYKYRSRNQTFTMNELLSYANKWGRHNFDVLAGHETYAMNYSYLANAKSNFFDPLNPEYSNAITMEDMNSYTYKYTLESYLGRLNYNFDERYFLSASYRRDGSSRFAPGRRWGDFWSVGAAWDIKSEPWMDAADQVDLLKVKLSYGAQGNDNLLTSGGSINYHPYADQYTLSENNGGFATTRTYKGNEDITWETSYNLNGGVDFSLFGERFGGTIEGYWRRTEDMLYYKPVAPSLGYSYLPVNVGSVSNAGIEIELKGDIIKTKNVTWNIYANASYNKNKILKLDAALGGEWISGNYIYREGENINQFYIREYAGVDPETGAALWWKEQEKVQKDENGDPVLDENKQPVIEKDENGNPVIETVTTDKWSDATQYAQGDLLPKVYGGFGTTLNAYGLDFSLAFAYQLGGKIYDNAYASLMHSGYGSAGKNWHTDILKSWTPNNTNTDVPRVNVADQYTTSTSDRFLVSSNYLSLQNITLGYTLPSKWTKKAEIEKVRIYFVADNVALVSARQGLDPRQSYTTSNSATYSPIRSISGGISLTF